MKRWKLTRILSALLALSLLLAAVPQLTLTAHAASGVCGENLTWSFDEATGTLTISGYGEMYDYSEFDHCDENGNFLYHYCDIPWIDIAERITGVRLPNGLTSIGDNAFRNCVNLRSAAIPDSVNEIGNLSFCGCSSLQSVNIPNSVSVIGWDAFFCCASLQSVTIPNSVTLIDAYTFSECVSLRSVSIPNSVTEIEWEAFSGCTGLQSVNIPSGVCRIGGNAFACCSSMKSVSLPDSLETIEYQAFYGCGNLSRISIPNSVKSIGEYAFSNCKKLKSVSLPNGLTVLEDSVFRWCYALADLTIPGSVTSIEDYAFSCCSALTQVVIPERVASIGRWAFSGLCKSDRSVLILNKDCTIYEDYDAFGDSTVTTLYGYPGSTAEAYAAKYGYAFQNLEEASFIDVSSGAYYAEPVAWAVEKGVTNGTSPYLFSPDATCTRAQVVTFLWRAAGEPEPGTDSNPFVDVAEGQYYYKAVLWAVEQGITNGVDTTHFAPNAGCTRGQVVTFLWRAEGKPEPASSTHPFTDVKAGEYYEKPVIWAVENGITTGTSTSLFSPSATCTRAQIVTFLYRAAGQA